MQNWIESQAPHMLQLLMEWSNINSGSLNSAGLDEQANALVAAFSELGGTIHRESRAWQCVTDSGVYLNIHGDVIRIRKRPDAPKQVVLCGHMDTVFPHTTEFQTCWQEGNILRGPGVMDMKGGLVVMLFALMALEQSSASKNLGWEVVLNADEETGSIASAADIQEAARGKDFGLVFEPAFTEQGDIVSTRKGSGKITLVVTGKAAHAGRHFHDGINAVTALSEMLLDLHALNGQKEGFTLNVGQVVGGIAENVVPEKAVARIDIRYEDIKDRDWITEQIERIQNQWLKKHTQPKLDAQIIFTRAPKLLDSRYQTLLNQVRDIGASLGQTIGFKHSGGVCDGNILASQGLVNVDTMGVMGGGMHSEDEFMHIDSLVSRTKLAALLLTQYANGEWSF